MNHVERFKAVMDFQPMDRLPVIEWAAYWDKTVTRWHGEGLPAEMKDAGAIRERLGLDCYRQAWVRPWIPKEKDAPQKDRDAKWYEGVRDVLYPRQVVKPADYLAWGQAHAKGETVVWMTLEGFFWYPRTLMGIERHLTAFYDEPELMHRMNADILEYNLRSVEQFCEVCTPDFMTFAEDMSYNHGPMLSKACFDEFLAPYYRRIVPVLKERGIVPIVDSDGDVTKMVPWLEEVGIEGILPLERQAGVDVALIRAKHPKFRMIGAFDKMVMKHGEAAMRREFERLLPVMRTGGFIPSVDHQTPPDVPLDTYRVYVALLKEYAEKAAKR